MKVNFYTFSFQNPARKAKMEEQFQAEGISLQFVEPVPSTDPRLTQAPDNLKRLWGIMFSHLDMLQTFLNSDADFGVFCEDDIRLRKNIAPLLPEVMLQFKRHNLEILLLSCLCTYIPVEIHVHQPHSVCEHPLVYWTYDANLWGAHMYMLDRKTAQKHLDKYNLAYAVETLTNSNLTHFSPDWTLTKDATHKAAIYPMLSLEGGQVNTDHEFQVQFHKQCFETHFNSDFYY
jgi:GR25 family glycosyltransferase involved in LPS biosynthesis